MRYRKARDGEPCTVCGCLFFKGDKVEIRRGDVQHPKHNETFEANIVKNKESVTQEEVDKILDLTGKKSVHRGWAGAWKIGEGYEFIEWLFEENGIDPYDYDLAAEIFMDECRELNELHNEEKERKRFEAQGERVVLIRA